MGAAAAGGSPGRVVLRRVPTREEVCVDEVPMGRVSVRRRALAVVSLVAAALLLAALVVFVVRNGGHLIVAVIGFAMAVGGGWWFLTERRARRTIGLGLAVVGMLVAVVAGLQAGAAADSPLLRLGLMVGLLVISLGAGRLAALPDGDEREARRHPPLRHPVLICNPWSGGGKVDQFGLVDLAHELGIETIMLDHGLDLEQLARDAVARGADCLGMAGGDGSQALVASIAVEHDLPFVCVSAGTRNHFALDLGLDRDDPRKSVHAYRDAIERRVDFATVNGRFFVNNVSLGVYATVVQQEGYREAKSATTRDLLPELLGSTEHPFDLQFTEPDGTEVDGAYLVQVSNNPYVLGPSLDVAQRRRLDSGRLGVFAVTGASGAEAAGVVTLSVVGQRRLSRNWHEFTDETFEVRSRSGHAFAGVDGEALDMETPLRFDIHPRGLRLLVPEGNLTVAERRRARDLDLADVLSVIRGIEPGERDAAASAAPGADLG
jgi:diacylglycerol kinase family enzyme